VSLDFCTSVNIVGRCYASELAKVDDNVALGFGPRTVTGGRRRFGRTHCLHLLPVGAHGSHTPSRTYRTMSPSALCTLSGDTHTCYDSPPCCVSSVPTDKVRTYSQFQHSSLVSLFPFSFNVQLTVQHIPSFVYVLFFASQSVP
jgi:hypothetical protein